METIEQLLKKNNEIAKARGQITPQTTKQDFYLKLIEEEHEVTEALKPESKIMSKHLASEIGNVIEVCANWLEHNGYDLKEVIRNNNLRNKKRIKR